MMNSSTLTTPQSQVDSLMQEVADEAGLELNMDLPQAQGSTLGASASTQVLNIIRGCLNMISHLF